MSTPTLHAPLLWTGLASERIRIAREPFEHWETESGRPIIARLEDEEAADDFLRGRLVGQNSPWSINP